MVESSPTSGVVRSTLAKVWGLPITGARRRSADVWKKGVGYRFLSPRGTRPLAGRHHG